MNSPPLTQKQFRKEALWPLLVGIAAILGLGGASFGLTKAVTGYQENIVSDSNQLRDILGGLPGKYPNNPQYTESLVQDSQNLTTLCQDLLQMINQQAGNQEAVNDFHNKFVAADMLIKKIKSEFEVLSQLEAIEFAPRINGHISDVESGLSKLSVALANAGQQSGLQRQEGGGMDLIHTPEGATPIAQQQPPLATSKSPLDDAEKAKVVDFLNTNYQQGTTLRNLPERLTQISNTITSQLGVENVTPQRLMSADVETLRGVFWIWKNPEAAAKYKTPSWEAPK